MSVHRLNSVTSQSGIDQSHLRRNTILAIGGGKGGIGKSFISSSLAICLARMGKSVTLVDLDLGSANLHTVLGVKIPQQTLSDFLVGKALDINQVCSPTEIQNLQLISGFNDTLNIADLKTEARDHLIHSLRALTSDYVILDLGAGTTENTLDFFLAADEKIVAVTPEPTSIENAYRFMKSAYYRKLKKVESDLGIHRLIETAMDSRNTLGIKSPADLLSYLARSHPSLGEKVRSEMGDFRLQILVNQVRTRQDVDLALSIRSVCKKYFGIEANSLGYIDYDNAVWQALRRRRPVVLEYAHSSVSGQFLQIAKNLLNPGALRAVI